MRPAVRIHRPRRRAGAARHRRAACSSPATNGTTNDARASSSALVGGDDAALRARACGGGADRRVGKPAATREASTPSGRWRATGAEVGCSGLGYATQYVACETSHAGLRGFPVSLAVVVCPLLEALIAARPSRHACVRFRPRRRRRRSVGGPLRGPVGAAPGDGIGLAQAIFGMAPPPPQPRALPPSPPSTPASSLTLPRPLRRTLLRLVPACGLARARRAAPEAPPPTPHRVTLTFSAAIPIAACSPAWAFGPADGAAAPQTPPRPSSPPPLGDPAALQRGCYGRAVVTSPGCTPPRSARARRRCSSSEATVVFSTEPSRAALAASCMLGETFEARCLMGGALTARGCACSGADQTDELVESAGRKLRSHRSPSPTALATPSRRPRRRRRRPARRHDRVINHMQACPQAFGALRIPAAPSDVAPRGYLTLRALCRIVQHASTLMQNIASSIARSAQSDLLSAADAVAAPPAVSTPTDQGEIVLLDADEHHRGLLYCSRGRASTYGAAPPRQLVRDEADEAHLRDHQQRHRRVSSSHSAVLLLSAVHARG